MARVTVPVFDSGMSSRTLVGSLGLIAPLRHLNDEVAARCSKVLKRKARLLEPLMQSGKPA
jgi:hypothetical protein